VATAIIGTVNFSTFQKDHLKLKKLCIQKWLKKMYRSAWTKAHQRKDIWIFPVVYIDAAGGIPTVVSWCVSESGSSSKFASLPSTRPKLTVVWIYLRLNCLAAWVVRLPLGFKTRRTRSIKGSSSSGGSISGIEPDSFKGLYRKKILRFEKKETK